MSLSSSSSSPMPTYNQQLTQMPTMPLDQQSTLLYNGQQMPSQFTQQNGFSNPNESQFRATIIDSLKNANNNGVAGGLNLDGSSKFAIENMNKDDVKVHEAVMDKVKIAELKDDFNKLLAINLVDDGEYLDQCLYHAKLFDCKKYVLNCVYNCYKTKYESLLEERPTIKEWLNYCLQMIIFISEKEFKTSCMSNGQSYKMPDLNSKVLLVPSRKRQHQDASIVAELIPKKKTLKHPFLEHDYYKLHRLVFHVGECAKYCIPGDFAELEMTSTICTLTKIINNTSTVPYDGLRVTFKKPVFAPLSGCLRKNYHFLQIESLQSVQDAISNITGLATTKDALQFGRAKQVKYFDIAANRKISPVEVVSTEDTREYLMVLLTSISIFRRSNKTYQGKAYTDLVFMANRDGTDIDADEMEKYNTVIRENVPKINAILEEYEAKLAN